MTFVEIYNVLRTCYACRRSEVATRQLRNWTADVLARVSAGEAVMYSKIAAEMSSPPHRITRFANYSVGGMDGNLFVCKRDDLNCRVAQTALMDISSVRYRRNPADLRKGRRGF